MNSIPTELISLILNFTIIEFNELREEELLVKELSNYSLISKRGNYSVKRLIWRKVDILNRKDLEGFIELLDDNKRWINKSQEEGEDEMIGKLVRNLSIKFQSSLGGKRVITPNLQTIEEEEMISYTSFLHLIQLLPNLIHLQLYLPTFIQFDSTFPTLLPLLNSLQITTPTYDITQSLLRQFLSSFPSITTLELNSQSPIPLTLKPLLAKECPKLINLIIQGSYWERILFDLNSTTTFFIPLECFIKLKTLEISAIGGSPFKFLPLMILAAKDSLKIFKFDGTTTSDSLIPTFKHLSQLIELDIWIRSQRNDLLLLIPSSVKIFKSPLNNFHLNHLILFPREELRLEEITLSSNDSICIYLIPTSVIKLNLLGFNLSIEGILLNLEIIHSTTTTFPQNSILIPKNEENDIDENKVARKNKSNLKEICFIGGDENELNFYRKRFKKLSIKLVN